MRLLDLNYNFECDWLIKLPDNKMFNNKLSDNNLVITWWLPHGTLGTRVHITSTLATERVCKFLKVGQRTKHPAKKWKGSERMKFASKKTLEIWNHQKRNQEFITSRSSPWVSQKFLIKAHGKNYFGLKFLSPLYTYVRMLVFVVNGTIFHHWVEMTDKFWEKKM